MNAADLFYPQPAPDSVVDRETARRHATYEFAFVFLLAAAAFVLRVWGLSKMHFWDENVYLQNAEVICCGKNNYSELSSRPPLLSILFAGAFLIWNSVYAAAIVTALVNALGPVALYFSGRMIVGRKAAGIGAMLLAFSPFFLGVFPPEATGFISDDTGNSLLSDSPALTLILVAFWLMLLALRRQTSLRFAVAGFVLGLSVLMRFGSLSSVGMISLLALAADKRWRAVPATAAGFALSVGPYLCWSLIYYGGFLATFRNGWENFEGPGESPFYFVTNFGFIFSWVALAGLILWLFQWGWEQWAPSSTTAGSKRPRTLELYLWFWALVVFCFFSVLRHKEPRYGMPVAAPLFILAGAGLGVLLERRTVVVRSSGAAILAAALTVSFLPLRHRLHSSFIQHDVSDEMLLSEFMDKNLPPSTIVYSNFNYPDYGFYSHMQISVLPERGPELFENLNHLPGDGYFVAYKRTPDNPDPEPPLAWLDANPHFHRAYELPTVVLYQYRQELQP
jgi:4-amino-4-deoxy-L-arabinose transferase-like glycosyltransferase